MLVVSAATGAGGHSVPPEAIIAKLDSPAARAAYGIASVQRSSALPRLLLVRVGPEWNAVPAEVRRAAADEWQRAWRHAVPHGIVAVLDARTDAPVVNFDAQGHAVVQDVAAAAGAGAVPGAAGPRPSALPQPTPGAGERGFAAPDGAE